MTISAALIADAVSRTYAGRAVVDHASLKLEPGRITALLGKSGAGKSTFLRLLAGLERPDGGHIMLGETILSSPKRMVPAEKRKIGLIFQDFALFPHLTALENTMFGLTDRPKAEAKAHAYEWLERIGLGSLAKAYPHQLSGGEQQRVAIARALAPAPVAILKDEPFSGLDPALREDVRQTALDAIRTSHVPALLVTHDASEAMLSADHLAVMRAGKIVQQGAPEAVYAQPVDKETAAALGPIIIINGTTKTGGKAIETALGDLPVSALNISGKVEVGIRPEAVLVDDTSPIKAKVISTRRNGPMRQLQIQIGNKSMSILVPATHEAHPAQEIGIRLDPNGCTLL